MFITHAVHRVCMSGKAASWWHGEEANVRCELCPHRCSIPDGAVGLCGVRRNEGGRLLASSYGRVCVRSLDPIEKKPLFHFHPGTLVHSFGTFGCNLDCDNCQNYELVRACSGGASMTPLEAVNDTVEHGAQGIAFTFNEPVTWYEFVLDTCVEARSRGLYTVLNTNGYIQREPAEELFRYVDAMNVDVKAFDERTYRSTCGGGLGPVLDTCLAARNVGVHVELTYLLIPGLNDSADEISRFSRWAVDSMGPDVPLFFYRFRPFYRLADLPEQSMERMREAAALATGAGARYVYFGGVAEDNRNTLCPVCSTVVIERRGAESTGKVCFKGREVSRFCPSVSDVRVNLQDGRCPTCGERIPVVL